MWRDPGRPVRVIFLDARACLPMLVYWSWPTFYIAVTGVTVFSVISWAGLTVPSALRMVRRAFVGPIDPRSRPGSAGGLRDQHGSLSAQDGGRRLCV